MPEETLETAPEETQPQPDGEIQDLMPELDSKDSAQAKLEKPPTQNKNRQSKSIDAMLNVDMNIQIVLGYSHMPIANLLKLSRGSVIELDRRIGEPVDIVINQSLVARGDLIKVGENRIGISLTEIVKDYIFEN